MSGRPLMGQSTGWQPATRPSPMHTPFATPPYACSLPFRHARRRCHSRTGPPRTLSGPPGPTALPCTHHHLRHAPSAGTGCRFSLTSRMVTPLSAGFARALSSWCGDWSMSVTFSGLTDLTMPSVQKPVPPPTSTTCPGGGSRWGRDRVQRSSPGICPPVAAASRRCASAASGTAVRPATPAYSLP